jgi:hypothetical protein
MYRNWHATFRESPINEMESWLIAMKLKNRLSMHQHFYVVNAKVPVTYDEVSTFLKTFVEYRISEPISHIRNVVSYESDDFNVGIRIDFQNQYGNSQVLLANFDGDSLNRDHAHYLSELLDAWIKIKFNNNQLTSSLLSFYDTLKEFTRHNKTQADLAVRYVIFDNTFKEQNNG